MKRFYIAMQRIQDPKGEIFKDQDGAHYYQDHSHPALNGQEFATPVELIQACQDYNREMRGKDFQPIGEVIISEVITF